MNTRTTQPGTPAQVAAALRQARARLRSMVEDLTDAQLRVPPSAILNPFLWELGHVAWFAERFLLREAEGRAPLRPDVDAHWDSLAVEHDTRWDLLLPSREATTAYMEGVLTAVLERLEGVEWTPAERDRHLLVLHHEDMHVEAFAYMRQTMAYPRPPLCKLAAPAAGTCAGDVELAGGRLLLGAPDDGSFAFDNERDAHEVEVAPFALARTLVTEGEFAAFTADGGYEREELWTPEGWTWRTRARAARPRYWRVEGDVTLRQAWDGWVPLDPARPVSHVTAYEAEAWCSWAGRRLPSEREWELAARACAPADDACLDFVHGDLAPAGACPGGDSPEGARQLLGNLWEWTSTAFGPYPGFRPGVYREYSEPWFTGHRVLRGGCWATAGRLIRATWRNFYAPNRGDVWCGFRSARSLE